MAPADAAVRDGASEPSTSDAATGAAGGGGRDVTAPTLSSADPNSVSQGASQVISLRGRGFLRGARAYWDGAELATTLLSSTELTARVIGDHTSDVGLHELTVRNLPSDSRTESGGLVITVTEPSSPIVTLVSLAPSTATVGEATTVTITVSGASGPESDLNYLILIDSGGVALDPILCTWIATDQCQASVTVAMTGIYDASLAGLTAGSSQTLSDSLTVNAAASGCEHDECLPGNSLAPSCSACATAICDADAACCTSAWGQGCVDAAAVSPSCVCDPPALLDQPLAPATQTTGETTAVTAHLLNAPETVPATGPAYAYELILTGPAGSGTFACAYETVTGACTAMVTGLDAGTYSASVRATVDQIGTQSYETNLVADAFVVTDGAVGGGTCAAATCVNNAAEDCECRTASGFSMVCAGVGQCECLDPSGSVIAEGSSAGACGSLTSIQATFVSYCGSACVD